MSNDLRVLFCGTAETIANVYIWDTTTFMKLGEFSVANVPVITHIKVSADNKSVLLLVSQSLILLFLGFDERVLLNDYNG
jgi:hypothetical protein